MFKQDYKVSKGGKFWHPAKYIKKNFNPKKKRKKLSRKTGKRGKIIFMDFTARLKSYKNKIS